MIRSAWPVLHNQQRRPGAAKQFVDGPAEAETPQQLVSRDADDDQVAPFGFRYARDCLGRLSSFDQHRCLVRDRADIGVKLFPCQADRVGRPPPGRQRSSEEHTSELQSLMRISSAVFCLKNNNITQDNSQIQPASNTLWI